MDCVNSIIDGSFFVTLLKVAGVLGGIALIIYILYRIFRSPFKYPYHTITFDVSGKRSPDIMNYIDRYLIDHSFTEFTCHLERVNRWKNTCQKKIESSLLKGLRKRQFANAVDDQNMFWFELSRKQTRYKQKYYVKSPYTVTVLVGLRTFDFKTLQQRYDQLAEIEFACTLAEYNSKEQRKLMTSELREEIARRDNYTCQICGKYMPDGVGLHIDHIVPIKKGGKTVPSNLQVLCSKCNGKKSSK